MTQVAGSAFTSLQLCTLVLLYFLCKWDLLHYHYDYILLCNNVNTIAVICMTEISLIIMIINIVSNILIPFFTDSPSICHVAFSSANVWIAMWKCPSATVKHYFRVHQFFCEFRDLARTAKLNTRKFLEFAHHHNFICVEHQHLENTRN